MSKREEEVAEQAQRLLDGLLSGGAPNRYSKTVPVDREQLRNLVAAVKLFRAVELTPGPHKELMGPEALARLVEACSALSDEHIDIIRN